MPERNTNWRPDYFTLVPSAHAHAHAYAYTHFSVETPATSPTYNQSHHTPAPAFLEHPLLASRETPLLPHPLPNMASNLMSRQTAAAHGHVSGRPRPYPMQNVLHVTSDDSTSSSDSSSSSIDTQNSCPSIARCSRCQRTPSIDVQTGKSNMVPYGLNLWYCSRCAGLVGLTKT